MKLDSVIIIDVEATCWDDRPAVASPEFTGEIIEIGVCLLNLNDGSISSKESIIVKPAHTKVSPFCTKLTTLTQADVDRGVSLYDACSILETKFQSKNRVWASYGDYDRVQFNKETNSKGVKYPFGPRHQNIKMLFALRYRLNEEVGMDHALGILKIPLEGTHHRGVDDAGNIAKIARVVLSPIV